MVKKKINNGATLVPNDHDFPVSVSETRKRVEDRHIINHNKIIIFKRNYNTLKYLCTHLLVITK